jgi:hypothetical protein
VTVNQLHRATPHREVRRNTSGNGAVKPLMGSITPDAAVFSPDGRRRAKVH